MSILDEERLLYSADQSGMIQDIQEFATHCTQAWERVQALQLPADYHEIDKIVFTGMGGSAMIGDVLATLIARTSPIPMIVSRGYDLPQCVDERTLVIASSHSGETEETIACFEAARAAKAKLLGIGTGGYLSRLANQWQVPFVRYEFTGQPRAAFGHAFVSLLGIAKSLNLLPDPSVAIEEACSLLHALLQEIGPDVPTAQNPAKQLASQLYERVPYVYAGPLLSQVAHRWKNQLNENSKTWAGWDVLPELNHNTIASYANPAEIWSKATIILLHAVTEHPRVAQRMQITADLLEQQGIAHVSVQAQGESELAQIFWAVHFGDFVSYYLAALYGADPSKIESISQLKEQLLVAREVGA